MKAKLTKRTVDEARPRATEYLVHDTLLSGFSLKVTPKGAKSYVFQYRIGGRAGRTRRVTIGTHGSPWTPDKARSEAEKHSIAVKQGIDPQARRQSLLSDAVTLAFDKYAEFFISEYLEEFWPRFKAEGARLLRREVVPVFGPKPLPSITRRDVTALFDRLKPRVGVAKNTSTVLRKLFKWAVSRGELTHSPMTEIALPKPPKSRRRYLNDAELRALWKASLRLNHPYASLVRTLILLGQRRDEASGICWDEIDLKKGIWTIPGERAKNGSAHYVPLPPQAVNELKTSSYHEGLVFSVSGERAIQNWSYWKRKIDQLFEAELADAQLPPPAPWTLHDLRRSVATGLQRLGEPEDVVEALQNRQARGGVAMIYQRHEYAVEKHIALVRWAAHVEGLVANVPSSSGSGGDASGESASAPI